MTTRDPSTEFGGTTSGASGSTGVDAGMTSGGATYDQTTSGTRGNQPGAQTAPEAAMASTVADTAQQVAHQAQERAGELVQRATERGREQLTDQKARAAEGLQDLAHATRRVGYDLRARDKTAVADLTDAAASQADRLGRFLRETDVNDMVRGVTEFGRSQPLLFLGGAFVIGVVGARFLKASAQQAAESGSDSAGTSTEMQEDFATPVRGRSRSRGGTRAVGVQALATGRVPTGGR